MDTLRAYFQGFIDWFYQAFVKLFQFLESVVLSLFDALKDFFFWIIDTLLGFVVSIINSFDFSFAAAFTPQSVIDALPPEVLNMMGLLGLGDCLVVITGAIIIRLLLQLIPFVRLGS